MSITDSLLREISHCPNVLYCLEHPNEPHACASIVRRQKVRDISQFQVPEPWTGHLDRAALLFLSSNPSISESEEYPRWSWPDALVREYFNFRFEGISKVWIKDGTKTLQRSGEYARATSFWAAIRKRAIELLGPEVRPGIDYALTELVHCKSKSEFGIRKAAPKCVELYLGQVLKVSPARVLVIMGKTARISLERDLHLPPHGALYGPKKLYGRQRLLVFLPHPNSRGPRSFGKRLTLQDLGQLRSYLT